MNLIRTTAPALGALLLVAGACSSNKEQTSNGMDTTAAAAATAAPTDSNAAKLDTAGTPGNPSSATAGATAGAWNNTSVVSFATVANDGEIQMGKLGVKKATNPQVKAFARQMVTDHTAMLAQAKKLGTTLSVTPDTTTGDAHDLASHANDEMNDLTNKAAGADWDKSFMDDMVNDHQAVLGKLQDAAKANTDSTVTKALTAATAKVQAHLTKAQAIQAKLK